MVPPTTLVIPGHAMIQMADLQEHIVTEHLFQRALPGMSAGLLAGEDPQKHLVWLTVYFQRRLRSWPREQDWNDGKESVWSPL